MDAEEQKAYYLHQVTSKIHSSSVRKEVKLELSSHIDEQLVAMTADHMEANAAMQFILEELGDPILLGQQFNHAHNHVSHWYWIAAAFLTAFLYNGNFMNYIDPSSLVLVIFCALLITRFRILQKKRWAKTESNLATALFQSGIVVAAVSLLTGLETGRWFTYYVDLILLPFWYGILLYLLLHVVTLPNRFYFIRKTR